MPVEVYMDECNVHEGADFLTVSAAWAEQSVWKLWEEDWHKAIQPLTSFHSYDVWQRRNSGKILNPTARDELKLRAMNVVFNHKINGRIGGINRNFLQNEFGSSAIANTFVSHPYYLPFIWTTERMLKILSDAGVCDVSFFHEQNDFESAALEHFEISKKRFDLPNYSLKFVEKKILSLSNVRTPSHTFI